MPRNSERIFSGAFSPPLPAQASAPARSQHSDHAVPWMARPVHRPRTFLPVKPHRKAHKESKQLRPCTQATECRKTGQFSTSPTRPLSLLTCMCLGEPATSNPCPSGKLMMAELVHDYRLKKVEMEIHIFIYIYINYGLLCNKANYNLLGKLPVVNYHSAQ